MIGRFLAMVALLWLVLAPFLARSAQAAGDGDPTVTASLLDPAIDAGDSTQYQVSVDNGTADKPPTPPVVDGLTITYVGPSQQYSINVVNGRFTRRIMVKYTYNVQAAKPGRFTIPGQDVSVGGSTLRTLPVTLTVEDVGAPAATPPGQSISSELTLAKKTAYVGESFGAELRAYFGLNVSLLALAEEPILGGEGFSVQKFARPRDGTQVVDGVRYRAVTYRTVVTGVKTGPVSVGPVDLVPTVQMPSTQARRRHRRRGGGGIFGDDDDSPFNQFFNGFPQMQPPQQVKVTAPPVRIEILPLPPGKPDGFSGGIGQFKLEVEAEPRRAQVGDPVTVRLILTGQGNFQRVNAPILTDDKGLRTYPATSRFQADDDVGLSGTKTFEQTVIADGPRASLPPYHFDYLDPATGKYVAVDTPPVAVRIEGGAASATPAVSTAPAVAAAVDTPAATPTPTPRPAQDILYIRHDPGRTVDRDAFLPTYRTRAFWLAQLVPLTALLLVGGWIAIRARGRNEAIRQQAVRGRQRVELQRVVRRETIGRRDFYAAAAGLARLGAAGGRALDPPTASAVQAIYQRHDELAYSGGQVALEPVPADERRTVLATLETLGRNGR